MNASALFRDRGERAQRRSEMSIPISNHSLQSRGASLRSLPSIAQKALKPAGLPDRSPVEIRERHAIDVPGDRHTRTAAK